MLLLTFKLTYFPCVSFLIKSFLSLCSFLFILQISSGKIESKIVILLYMCLFDLRKTIKSESSAKEDRNKTKNECKLNETEQNRTEYTTYSKLRQTAINH